MNSNGNLPPGCKVTDIPGNRPEDVAFDKFLDNELEICYEEYYDEVSNGEDGYLKYFEERDYGFIEYVRDKFEKQYYRRW